MSKENQGQITTYDDNPIWYAIVNERRRQEQLKREGRFKFSCADDIQNAERLAVLAEGFGEVACEVSEELVTERLDVSDLKKKLVQVAAVCVAWLEALSDE